MICIGQNPATSLNARVERKGMRNLDWLVVKDNFLTESATFWYKAPEIERGEPDAALALRELDSLTLTGPTAWLWVREANLLGSRLYEAFGDTARALAAVRRHYFIGPPFYLSSYLPQEGRLAALTGDRAGRSGRFSTTSPYVPIRRAR